MSDMESGLEWRNPRDCVSTFMLTLSKEQGKQARLQASMEERNKR